MTMRKLMMSIVMMAAILGMQSNVHAKSQIFNKSTKKIDVIVVGAGVSGLTMAYHLKKIGKSFQILEQSSHIGGRVRTAAYPNGKAEVGLEEFWDNNPFLKVMRELNVPLETVIRLRRIPIFNFCSLFYPLKN
jgi:ribulose 1,5-bisphosphate synthetase/thiazole synthase